MPRAGSTWGMVKSSDAGHRFPSSLSPEARVATRAKASSMDMSPIRTILLPAR